jgi:hypothetical protein
MVSRYVVTGGDAAYFPLLDDLAASIRRLRPADALGLAVIDAGLEAEQRRHLSDRYGARILDVGWEFDLPAAKVRGREHLKVQIARAFLDRHLPDADVIAWIDGDAWVQDIGPLDLILDAAADTGRLVIVSQAGRYSEVAMSIRWAGLGYAQIRSILYKNARRAGVAESLARRLAVKPTLNSGVFALRRDAPHWDAWRSRQGQVLRKGRIFTSDQLGLGLAVYVDGMPVELAPELCNYMGPYWACSADERILVERYIPNSPVGIVHMAGYDEMRRDPGATVPIQTLDGRTVNRSLRYRAWVAADRA